MAAKQGESHHKAKLTEDDVREMRERHAAGESIESIWLTTFVDLGIESCSTIGYAIHRKTWRHVR
ncbi:hypothetical protein [Streptomyces hydrogenans]|uniref:Integrase n=1 Tax=Streptomyces hydrogenans TaxID=1873719 RepID=A0ABQ3PJG3_9ACTN|nr:hypothetical protein [Streptomyces hydrogenans]GHF94556.1 hypothetical protein GCM10018784_02780 [Streptomyces hydrogenans]GHI25152.1 hypothetical protein Shyd_65230 [Streptomyces hydrogenans]